MNWIIKPTGQILLRNGYRLCTGFLIGQQTFLTAGHCLGETYAGSMKKYSTFGVRPIHVPKQFLYEASLINE